ncbi:MAG: NACHT domain-containing protein, partial [Dethiobacter sp.]|nr:NACHT domain-containing protein [Dethiobacter sp.]
MKETPIGNVDNHASVGSQTNIYIRTMSGNIAVPDKSNTGQTADRAFDEQVLKLNWSAQALSDSLGNNDSRGKETKVQEFNDNVAHTIALAKQLSNPSSDVTALIAFAEEWDASVSMPGEEIATSGHDIGLLFTKMRKAIRDYVMTVIASQSVESGTSEDAIRVYLDKSYNWHRKLKTLLYDKTPREFYDFYVCNDLKYNNKVIGGITAARLRSISNYVIVSGTGGLGKTMMMRHLLLNAIDNYDSLGLLPIFIPLKEFSESTSNLLEYIHSVVNQFNVNLTLAQLTSALTAGLCLLLFDGMDEVKSSVSMRFSQGLESLACSYPNNCFVLSSRPSRMFLGMNNFCEMELQPFSKMQAMKMIDNFAFSHGEEKIKENFRVRLDNDLWWSHQEFAENPLLLTIMLMTFEEYAEVPSKIHKFYEKAFDTLAKKHDDNKLLVREFKSGLSKDEISELLAKICFLSYKDENYEFTEDEFKNYFEHCRKNMLKAVNADDFLQDLCGNLCILLLDGGKYRFVHRSFQEYFCALNIRRTFDKVSADKKAQLSKGLVTFFDGRKVSDDKVLEMLYDMAQEKVDEFILVPKLESLLGSDSNGSDGGYWAFLEKAFSTLRCWHEYHECMETDEDTGEVCD